MNTILNRFFRWVKMLFFKLTGKRMINLPTDNSNPPLINADEVKNVILIKTLSGEMYFVYTINKVVHTLTYTPELAQWFSNSGILVAVLECAKPPELAQAIRMEKVGNIPAHYKKPSP